MTRQVVRRVDLAASGFQGESTPQISVVKTNWGHYRHHPCVRRAANSMIGEVSRKRIACRSDRRMNRDALCQTRRLRDVMPGVLRQAAVDAGWQRAASSCWPSASSAFGNNWRRHPDYWTCPAVVADAKAWQLSLDRRNQSTSKREFPPQQMEWYLDRSRLPFGILTNTFCREAAIRCPSRAESVLVTSMERRATGCQPHFKKSRGLLLGRNFPVY